MFKIRKYYDTDILNGVDCSNLVDSYKVVDNKIVKQKEPIDSQVDIDNQSYITVQELVERNLIDTNVKLYGFDLSQAASTIHDAHRLVNEIASEIDTVKSKSKKSKVSTFKNETVNDSVDNTVGEIKNDK